LPVEQIWEHLQLLAVGVVLLFFTQFLALKKGFYRPLEEGKKDVPRSFFRAMLGAFVVYFAAQLTFFLLALGFFKVFYGMSALTLRMQGALSIGMVLFYSLVLGLYLVVSRRETKDAVVRDFSNGKENFLFGAMTWAVSYPFVLVIGQLMTLIVLLVFQSSRLDQVAVQNLKIFSQDPFVYWPLAFLIVTWVPITEEILFRGFLQTSLKPLFGVKGAIAVASFIFSMFHFSLAQGVDNIELISSLFVLSCFLGYIYERQNSLFAPIGLHVTFNFIMLILISFFAD
jgi:hypothetical protein